MAISLFISLLLIVLSNQLRTSLALKEETVINISEMDNEESNSLKVKNNAHQDETIIKLKSQLKDHEDRIHLLERNMIGSQKTYPMSHSIIKQQINSDDVVFNSNKMRVKRPYRLLPASPSGLLQSNKRKEDDPTKRMPTSCADLNSIGHTLNAFYIVKEKLFNTTKLQTIYCDFQKSASSDGIMEKRLGFLDIKSSASEVYFYVQGNTKVGLKGPAVIQYDVQRLNIGGGMNRLTGGFTVPKSGVYHFDFVGLKFGDMEQLVIFLRVNGVKLASSFSGIGPVIVSVAIHSTLKLKRGDRVDIFIEKGTLVYCRENCIHFTGWLMEEDLPSPF